MVQLQKCKPKDNTVLFLEITDELSFPLVHYLSDKSRQYLSVVKDSDKIIAKYTDMDRQGNDKKMEATVKKSGQPLMYYVQHSGKVVELLEPAAFNSRYNKE
jgi:hypothetical protein